MSADSSERIKNNCPKVTQTQRIYGLFFLPGDKNRLTRKSLNNIHGSFPIFMIV